MQLSTQTPSAQTLGSRCLWLAAGMSAAGLLALLPAYQLFGVDGLKAVGISLAACFLAGSLVLILSSRATGARLQIQVVLWGTALRVIFAVLAALVLDSGLGISPRNYLWWLGLFYFVGLAIETWLVAPRGVSVRSAARQSSAN